jgi:zinc transporter, ZIP family
VVYTFANVLLSKQGAKHRKRSGNQQPSDSGSGLAIVLGSLLDGIPESVVIGVSLIGGGVVSLAAVIAIFLSNIPEGLSGTAGMKKAGRSTGYIFGLWGGIAATSGIAALVGYTVVGDLGPKVLAANAVVHA